MHMLLLRRKSFWIWSALALSTTSFAGSPCGQYVGVYLQGPTGNNTISQAVYKYLLNGRPHYVYELDFYNGEVPFGAKEVEFHVQVTLNGRPQRPSAGKGLVTDEGGGGTLVSEDCQDSNNQFPLFPKTVSPHLFAH